MMRMPISMKALYLAQTGHHDAHADQHEADENVELAAVEERWHDGDAQDTGIGVVAPTVHIIMQ